ncbi:putative cytochrome c oxidase subunit III [Nocardia nova SH22a]|uniref:Cytochrome aa3 subunit 3 n=1 Tax=Nocardia nova SH22a TaxID=1415166 RepID=W5TQF5_9NOCA|nr:cytochrome c oxidase subunit 3 [Nocardia nova]AHH19466.1 putative cytochrome c oxidase subunit III [Nocardia nova SH22a]
MSSDVRESVPWSVSREKPVRRIPGDPNMWIFILGDFLIFSVYLVIFMIDRQRDPGAFLEQQRGVHLGVGVFDTVLLLTSSLLVARGVLAARGERYRAAVAAVTGAGLCGLLFVVVKAGEWTSEIRSGATFPSGPFYMYYYMLTGIHLFHVVLGLLILGLVVRDLRDPRGRRLSMTETGATYWHMVDLLWLLIFALVYVMR